MGGHRKLTMVGLESVKEFNQRIFREGRMEDFKVEVAGLQAAEGISYAEARQRLAAKYGAPALSRPAIPADLKKLAGEISDDAGIGYWEALNWACSAVGQAAEGKEVKREHAPSNQAWGLYRFAMEDQASRKAFYGLWTAEGRRRAGDSQGGLVEAKKQVVEIDQVLREVLEESRRLVHLVEDEK